MRGTDFNKGDLVLIVGAGETPVQGLVQEIVSQNIVKVKTTTGVRMIFKTGLRMLKRARKEVMVICEAATAKCAEMGCPHGKAHVAGVLGNCSHDRFKCQRSNVTGVTKKVRCKKVGPYCDCLDVKHNDAPKEDVNCILPQPDPNCKKCGGGGYV